MPNKVGSFKRIFLFFIFGYYFFFFWKGSAKTLDLNHFQTNLLASGAIESEIFIWDLNNFSKPMTPGTKCQPLEEVLSLAWNRQVQHILASVFSTKCVIWDLKKNEPIIKLTDSNTRAKWRSIAWHPEIATQLCLASDDDHIPVIQLWDLRYATAPLKVFQKHEKGILDISWCHQDSEMLLSSGKDNRILCWNPNSDVAVSLWSYFPFFLHSLLSVVLLL